MLRMLRLPMPFTLRGRILNIARRATISGKILAERRECRNIQSDELDPIARVGKHENSVALRFAARGLRSEEGLFYSLSRR